MNKEKFGKYFYIASIVLSIVLLVIAVIFLNVREIDQEDVARLSMVYAYRYMAIILVLFILIPTGSLVREICLGKYDKKIILIKFLIGYIGGIGGIITLFILRNQELAVKIGKVIALIGALFLVYAASPSVKENKR